MSLFKISEKFVLNKLKNITQGNLKLINYDGKVFHFGDLESKLSYTNLAGNNVNDFLRLPKFKYFGKLYYSDIWFDKKIPIELGTNLYFRSSYFANAFSPDIQQFYIQNHFKLKKPLPVVKPGTQSRRFTHIQDTIDICIKAWKKNKCIYYSISNKKSYSILEVAKLFNSKSECFFHSRKVIHHSVTC